MKIMIKICAIASVAMSMMVVGCNRKTVAETAREEISVTEQAQLPVIGSKPVGMVLKASVFRMSGDYADHVAVTISDSGEVLYYPAPTDISKSSEPRDIGDGWWLNCQGLGANSVFTRWTFAEYRALDVTPSPEEIKAAVIAGACVTAFEQLPVSASEAQRMSPSELLKLVEGK